MEQQTKLLVGIVAVGFLVLVMNPVVFVPAGYRGVMLNFGAVGEVLSEGIHLRVPIYQSAVNIEVRTQKYEAHASAASKDLQDAYTTVALNYHLVADRANIIYRDIGPGWNDKVIAPTIQESVKAATAHYTAEELITKRELVKTEVEDALRKRLEVYNIFVEQLSLTEFRFSEQFTKAIEEKVTQEQMALKEEQTLKIIQIQAQQKVATAKGESESITVVAAANANATLVKAQSEAKAVQLISEQLSNQPKYVEYVKANRWDGALPKVTGGVVPFMDTNMSI